ncbi:MAG TPA: preprotein translocase subunit SecE [Steroidobacteraceae bacterium]|jgi:preprotein translocase subunit SecE|nr:preprotein translocase subunit SecE [Steroidobacteraceae bacterium]
MAEVQTPTVSASKDNALLGLSIVAILGGIAAFYWYDELALPLRVGMVILGLAAGAGLLWLSSYGREFVQFAQAARVELRKVVWPNRTETFQTTYVVIGFAIVMGVFFFLLDLILTWMTRFLGGTPG